MGKRSLNDLQHLDEIPPKGRYLISLLHPLTPTETAMSTTLELPIDLEALPPETRSWIITKSSELGISPKQLAHDEMVKAASRDGFKPKKHKAI